MTGAEALQQGRESFRRRAWNKAFEHLSAADREAPLGAEDLERLALAAHLTGREAEQVDLLARAHQSFLGEGASRRASRCAFWLGFTLLFNGELAQAGGWLSRAGRLIEGEGDCVEQGYLLVPVALRSFHAGDAAGAYEAFATAVSIGERFGDTDLVAMARHGQGRALIRQGDTKGGVSLLDEAMVAVVAGEVSPEVAGAVYCSVIESCQESLDLRRAQEWTTALDQWCEAQPELVPYRGHCLLNRAEIKQLRGAWADALEEADRARERLSQPTPKPAVGAAFYRIAELHRLRGEFTAAEEAYRQANQWERAARPGLALLRLARGQVDAAREAIHRALAEAQGGGARARILEASVEIALAAKDVAGARAAVDELAEIGGRHKVPYLEAVSAGARGAVLLAEHDVREALASLRRAWTVWQELEAPYEAARIRVLLALACREEGDAAAAEMELRAAREVFERLGAVVDLARLDKLARRGSATAPLTGREVQVLGLLASGLTNRQIAERLRISEKTVARHLANIYLRIGVSTRSAATAYAYQNGLV